MAKHRNSLESWFAYQRTSLAGDVRMVFEFWLEYVHVHVHDAYPTNHELQQFVEEHHPEFIAENVHKRTATLKDRGVLKEGPNRLNPTGKMAHTLVRGDGQASCTNEELNYYGRAYFIGQHLSDDGKAAWTTSHWVAALGGQRGVKACEKLLAKMESLLEVGDIFWDTAQQRMRRRDNTQGGDNVSHETAA